MEASDKQVCDTNTTQIQIVPKRILGIETAEKLLNKIYNCGKIIRVMIQGSNLPGYVTFGPGKGEKVNHPLKTNISISGQKIDLKTTVGRLYIEVENDNIANDVYNICKEILPFGFEYYKGIFFKKHATIVDYAKYGPNSDKKIWGLSDPKVSPQNQISYINISNENSEDYDKH